MRTYKMYIEKQYFDILMNLAYIKIGRNQMVPYDPSKLNELCHNDLQSLDVIDKKLNVTIIVPTFDTFQRFERKYTIIHCKTIEQAVEELVAFVRDKYNELKTRHANWMASIGNDL